MEAKKILKCAIVVRISDGHPAIHDKTTTKLQIEEIRKYIEAKNFNNTKEKYVEAKVYELEGVSGSKSFRSKQFEDLEFDISRREIQVVICTALDRLGRDVQGFLLFYKKIQDLGVTLICTRMSLDTSSDWGKAIVVILMALAELELAIKRERNRKSSAARRSAGYWTGGRPFLGYDINQNAGEAKKLVVNEEEAEWVRLAFRLYLELGSYKAVAEELKSRGCTNKQWVKRATNKTMGGGPITCAAVETMLKKIEYMAKQRFVEKDVESGEVIEIIVDAVWEPIVSAELFEEVQKAIGLAFRSKRNIAGKDERHVYLLLEIASCEYCGAKLVSRSGTGRLGTRYYDYFCRNDECSIYLDSGDRNHLNADDCDEVACQVIKHMLQSEESISEMTEALNKKLLEEYPQLVGEMKTLTNRKSEIKRLINSMIQSLTRLDEDSRGKTIANEEIEKNALLLEQIEKRIARLKGQIKENNVVRKSKEQVRGYLETMQSLTTMASDAQRRDVVRFLFSGVVMSMRPKRMTFQFSLISTALACDLAEKEKGKLTSKSGFGLIKTWRLVKDLNLRPSG